MAFKINAAFWGVSEINQGFLYGRTVQQPPQASPMFVACFAICNVEIDSPHDPQLFQYQSARNGWSNKTKINHSPPKTRHATGNKINRRITVCSRTFFNRLAVLERFVVYDCSLDRKGFEHLLL